MSRYQLWFEWLFYIPYSIFGDAFFYIVLFRGSGYIPFRIHFILAIVCIRFLYYILCYG